MPEGDTIFRTAVNLRAAIEGAVVTQADSRRPDLEAEHLGTRRLESVEARGKHLLMRFDHGHVLHSHMGMTGAWHLYHVGEPWKKPARRAEIVLTFDRIVAVCFSPKLMELLTATAFRRHRYLQSLGPDLLAAEVDEGEVIRRFRVHRQSPVGEVIMNQTVSCGIGNVYKSEVLFLTKINPFLRVQQLDDEQILSCIRTARRLMRRNLEGYPRRTRFRGDAHRLWVYDRSGQPCYVCGELIQMRRQGDLGRSTYWCSQCQTHVATS